MPTHKEHKSRSPDYNTAHGGHYDHIEGTHGADALSSDDSDQSAAGESSVSSTAKRDMPKYSSSTSGHKRNPRFGGGDSQDPQDTEEDIQNEKKHRLNYDLVTTEFNMQISETMEQISSTRELLTSCTTVQEAVSLCEKTLRSYANDIEAWRDHITLLNHHHKQLTNEAILTASASANDRFAHERKIMKDKAAEAAKLNSDVEAENEKLKNALKSSRQNQEDAASSVKVVKYERERAEKERDDYKRKYTALQQGIGLVHHLSTQVR